jgi:hypothetical protein
MNKWGKWILLFFVAMAFAVPAWAVDLKLGGKYEIQGRYYNEYDIMMKEKAAGRDETEVTRMFLKHYFNLYPTIQVTEKIAIKGDLELFDNVISQDDTRQYYDKSSAKAGKKYYPEGGSDNFDAYDVFTVNELYVDATTDYGKFILGKLKKFNGIGWFIQAPAVPDWTFGLVWNKKDEALPGFNATHDLADADEFGLIANYAKDAIDFKGTLAFKKSGHDASRTEIWYPYAYLNYAISKDIKINSKFGFATGPFIDKKSPASEALVAGAAAPFGANLAEDIADMIEEATGVTPDEDAVAAALTNGFNANFPTCTMKKDWEVDSMFGIWLGAGFTMDALMIQGDVAYMPGADEPQKISAYLEDDENLGTWLMNDIHDRYAGALETPATIYALGDPVIDGNFSYANVILVRLNLGYKFTDKFDANMNVVWGKKENVDYPEKWQPELGAVNAMDPKAFKLNGTGIAVNLPIVGPYVLKNDAKNKVDDDLGWEARAKVNYKLQDNLAIGLDLCYYAPGDYYKDYIEYGNFREPGDNEPKTYKMKDTYAARWIAKVTF